MTNRILRLPEVITLTGLSKTHLYRLIKENKFPKQLKLGARASGWNSEDISSWMESLQTGGAA